ncbi:MAG: hypothetical protein AB7L71_15380, partial [Vicinamibacterales bacterium]
LAFGVMAGVISVGALLLGLMLPAEQMYVLPLAMSGALALLAVMLMVAWKANTAALAADRA